MATTSERHPERFYSLNVVDTLGNISNSSKSYICGLMKISGARNTSKNPELSSRRLNLAHSIRTNQISESDLFFLKDYIQRYYPDYKSRLRFNLNS